MKYSYTLLFLLFLMSSLCAQPARNQKFAGAGYLGVNLSQIHGDSYFGYNKPGLRFGIETQYLLKPQYFISVGLGYTQEGASPNEEEVLKKRKRCNDQHQHGRNPHFV